MIILGMTSLQVVGLLAEATSRQIGIVSDCSGLRIHAVKQHREFCELVDNSESRADCQASPSACVPLPTSEYSILGTRRHLAHRPSLRASARTSSSWLS